MGITKAVLIILTLSLALAAYTTNAKLTVEDPTCMTVAKRVNTCADAVLSGSVVGANSGCCDGMRAVMDSVGSLGLGTFCGCVLEAMRIYIPEIVDLVGDNSGAVTVLAQISCNLDLPCNTLL